MKNNIPYTKEIEFPTKIAEISSISLESEVKVQEGILEGNFIVSGEYKAHEISVNKEPFVHHLPFSVDLPENTTENDVHFEITDFSYEIIDSKKLKVAIESSLEIEEKEETLASEEREKEPLFEEAPFTTVELPKTIQEALEETTKEEELVDQCPQEIEEKEDRQTKEEIILESTPTEEDTYITYYIHEKTEEESYESICANYKISMDTLANYNDLSQTTGKIIIPTIENE